MVLAPSNNFNDRAGHFPELQAWTLVAFRFRNVLQHSLIVLLRIEKELLIEPKSC